MKLNDRQIKNAKPAENRSSSMTGRACICISIRAAGSYGGLTFRITAKEKTFTIGKYPTISLVEARQAAEKRPPFACIGARPQRSQATGKTRTASRRFKYL